MTTRGRSPKPQFLLFMLLAASGRNRVVHVVIPNGFTGEARLVYDPKDGTVPECGVLSCVYRIPAAGELRIKSQELFARLHYETVRFSNGQEAKVARAFSQSEMVGLTSSSSDPGITYVWVIESTPAR
jgi:hypothetical protein